jgi:small conductance mechanosensitive channel
MLKTSLHQILQNLGLTDLPPWATFLLSISNVVLILALAWLARGLVGRLVRAAHSRLIARQETADDRRRMETLERVTQYILTVVVAAITVMLVLSEFGISIAPILATAGVAGLAVGFGAQSLVKDYFTGFVMLIENQIRVGDAVEVAGKSGLVEELTLRYVRLRDDDGAVHFVPNGSIATVTNRSRLFAYAVVEFELAHGQNLDLVVQVMGEVAQALQSDAAYQGKILQDLDLMGVERLTSNGVVIRARIKTVALEQSGVRREYLRRLQAAFTSAGIALSAPATTTVAGR